MYVDTKRSVIIGDIVGVSGRRPTKGAVNIGDILVGVSSGHVYVAFLHASGWPKPKRNILAFYEIIIHIF